MRQAYLEGRGKVSGADFKLSFAHVWRLSGGKVSRVQTLYDTAVMRDALNG